MLKNRGQHPVMRIFLLSLFCGSEDCPTVYIPSTSGGSDGKESTCSAQDLGSVPGLGRFPGKGNSYSLQYSCLENSMDGGAWQGSMGLHTTEWLSLFISSPQTQCQSWGRQEKESSLHDHFLAKVITKASEMSSLKGYRIKIFPKE